MQASNSGHTLCPTPSPRMLLCLTGGEALDMTPKAAIQKIDQCLKAGEINAAEAMAQETLRNFPASTDVWLRLARIHQLSGDYSAMLNASREVLSRSPNHSIARLQEAEALIQTGQIKRAIARLLELREQANDNPSLLQHVGELLTKLSEFSDALTCYQRAVTLNPNNATYKYNLATALSFSGQQVDAERLLDQVITDNPLDFRAWHTRSNLRRQTADHNHIDVLQQQLAVAPPGGKIQLHYALAKELEDLGEWSKAFQHLKAGADIRRKGLQYRVDTDVKTMASIQEHMGAAFLKTLPPQKPTRRIFVLGLPRSGTTLVDRILASHDRVESLGEINDWVMALTRLAGKVSGKDALVERTTHLDLGALGEAYLETTGARQTEAPILLDKTPNNFLYIGLIAKALPDARIIHLRRNPLDSCFAMYKTLFGMGYPFSYDLQDLATYYAAYNQLMSHWHHHLPGRVLDVDYDELVYNQEPQSRRLLDFCDLDWQDNVLDFHRVDGVAATASAAQVRQKIHTGSVGKWRKFEKELKPLMAALESLGIEGLREYRS